MAEELYPIILFGVGVMSGFMNVMAGGGSSLSLPALIFLGLDSTLANGTNRIAIVAYFEAYTNLRYSLCIPCSREQSRLFPTQLSYFS